MKFNGYIWDFGGTIINTYPALIKGVIKILEEFNINEDYEEILKQAKISKKNMTNYYMNKYNLGYDFVTKIKMAEHMADPESRVPFDGIVEILKYIYENGGVNYVFTHRNRDSAYELLKKNKIEVYFDSIIAKEDELARKPSPEGIFYIIHKQKLEHSKTLAIGDRRIDVEAAKNAGVSSVFFNEDKNICDIADYNISNFHEMFDIIK